MCPPPAPCPYSPCTESLRRERSGASATVRLLVPAVLVAVVVVLVAALGCRLAVLEATPAAVAPGVPLLEMPLSLPLMLSRSVSAGRERAMDLGADSEAAESPLPR